MAMEEHYVRDFKVFNADDEELSVVELVNLKFSDRGFTNGEGRSCQVIARKFLTNTGETLIFDNGYYVSQSTKKRYSEYK